MKHILLIMLCCVSSMFAQTTTEQATPKTMSYQAVIRDAQNNLVANGPVAIRISIVRGILSSSVVYSELHTGMTNTNGLVSLEIGNGQALTGAFATIDWAKGPYSIRTETDNEGGDNFSIVGTSPLLSVPYALHAESAAHAFSADRVLSFDYMDLINRPTKVSSFINDAGYVTREELGLVKAGEETQAGGVQSTSWSTKGNKLTNSANDKLGTTDYEDLMLVSYDVTRIRLTAAGEIRITGNTYVSKELEVGTNLIVKNNVNLNTTGGSTNNNGPFTVKNSSATSLTGKLTVDGTTELNNTLDVDGATTLNNTLDVDGATWMHSSLRVDGAMSINASLSVGGAATFLSTIDVAGATTLNSTLDVDGATTLNNTLDVDGATTLNSTLDVDGATTLNNTMQILSNQGGHVATLINTNGDAGDGLLIKLGRTHGAWNGGGYLEVTNPATFIVGGTLDVIKSWFNGQSVSISDIFDMFPAEALAGALAGSLAKLTNKVIDEINDGLDLRWEIIPRLTLFPGIDLGLLGSIDEIAIGPYFIPEIPHIPTDGLPNLEVPNLSGTSVTNSLTRENHYVTFQDKDGRQTGAIKAESLNEWRDNVLFDDTYVATIAGSFIKIDLLNAAVQGFSKIAEITKMFNQIGVAYESGNGDYAEWLERANPAEHIAAGDIVGVRGGKISKDITGAEQTMVVSHSPIVLGNMPEQKERYKGNDVAFMGQVPVKIMGPVTTGDYIVASGTIKGYGIAVPAAKMQADDYTKVVGRSWANDPSDGPKMVNTVIGVHNGDWVKVVKKIDDRQKKSDERQVNTDRRLKSLETKLQSILGLELNEEVSVTP